MIFSIQRFLEDHFERLGLLDVDQYAVSLANLYDRVRRTVSAASFLQSAHRIRTVFYRNNHRINRKEFEKSTLALLDQKFKKKATPQLETFPGGLHKERQQFKRRGRLTISSLLEAFKKAVESRAIDSFWVKRKIRQLRPHAETIGQGLLAVFSKGALSDDGLVWREVFSGIGFVDVVVVLSRTPHLIELKIMKNRYDGAAQLSTYMRTESRPVGWLVLFDARGNNHRTTIPNKTMVPAGVINNLIVDIDPVAPSHQKTHRLVEP
jgi:hypothetical protein